MKRSLKEIINLKALLTGSKDPWKKYLSIHTVEDLLKFARRINQAGEDFNGWVVELESDLDLHGVEWEPIGKDIDHPFCGEFDGKNHRITGLSLHSDSHYVGFFGVIYPRQTWGLAEVRNLNLADCDITGTQTNSWTGGIAGFVREGLQVQNCHVAGTLRSYSYLGGILGVVNGSVSIRESWIEGYVISENNAGIVDRINVAGSIVGKLTTDSILHIVACEVTDGKGHIVTRQVGKFDDTPYE